MAKIVALDIGGTNTRVALINEKYEIESLKIAPTLTHDVPLFLERVRETVEEGIKDWSEVAAIATGVPGRVRYDGYIYALPNVYIEQVPLAAFLSESFHKPAFVINDAEVAALAESNVGALKMAESLYFVTISTGVGGALTVHGKLRNSSYEAGHTMTAYKNEVHEFEHLVSGGGIVRLAAMNDLRIGDAKEFFELVREGNPLAQSVCRDWVRLVGDWLEMIHAAFEPAVFALTGGVMKSSDVFFDDLRNAAPHCHLEHCALGQEAGLIGSAVLGFQKTAGH